jgi:hypothetical protein
MGLLKKKDREEARKTKSRLRRAAAAQAERDLAAAARYVEKQPPCIGALPERQRHPRLADGDRQREKLGLSLEEACDPRLASGGRDQPVPLRDGAGLPAPVRDRVQPQGQKDGAVAINSVERFIGDYAIEHEPAAAEARGRAPYPRRSPSSAPGRPASPAPTSWPGAATRSRCSRPSTSPAACCATASRVPPAAAGARRRDSSDPRPRRRARCGVTIGGTSPSTTSGASTGGLRRHRRPQGQEPRRPRRGR